MNTVKVHEGDQASRYYPSKDIVQSSGTSYCPSNQNIGTLGVRVDCSPSTGICFIATYHNFAEDKADFAWVYNANGVLK